MNKERFETGKIPHISISECNSELVIRGWDDPDVLVKGEQYKVHESEKGLSISSSGKLRMMVPDEATLSIERVHSDLVIKNVMGECELAEANGDVILVGLGNVTIDTIHNDLSAKKLSGSVTINTVHGDVVVREVNGLVAGKIHGDLSARFVNGSAQLGQIMGDISLRNVTGEVTVEKGHRDANLRNIGGKTKLSDIRGDIRLYGALSEEKHTFTAAGDLILRWPDDVPLTVTATGSKIANKLDFDEVVEADGTFTGNIEGSQTFVSLAAKGQVILKSIHIVDEKWEWEQAGDADFDFAGGLEFDLSGLGERISSQVNEQIARVTADLEGRFGPDFSQKMAEKIAKQAERAVSKAQREAEKAMRHAERGMRHGRWRGDQHRRRRAPAAKKTATNEEQLKILKMVEQGIISTDEASTLLEALEK